MIDQLEREIRTAMETRIKDARDLKTLEEVRVEFLGRKDGKLTKQLRALSEMPIETRRTAGPKLNSLRKELEKALKEKLQQLTTNNKQSANKLDITMPGKKIEIGHLHPLTLVENKVKEIFLGLNFSVIEGPEIESEYYNFDALNIPPNHPARDMWDTFWLKTTNNKQLTTDNGRKLLRTHTSPMQIRYMEKNNPPFQIIVPGRTFRFEATDASHEINFHQVEGLMVGKDVSLSNFKYIIEQFLHRLFGLRTEVRFRPSYFPFVEPGLEVDVKINDPKSKLHGTWLELMGAGMVHPKVFDAVGYNPKEVQGFAFGLGLDRVAMIKYNIPDIRMFYSGDLKFINQF